ncbi:MAG TPA: hypothetical protein VIV55_01405 [Flavobacterium sp.]
MNNRNELITKYERNLHLIVEFKIVYRSFLDITKTWDSVAFPDSNITNRQYFETLNQISEQEYSEQQYQAIKTVFIHDNAIKDYIINLEIQYNNLKLLFDEISIKNKNLIE